MTENANTKTTLTDTPEYDEVCAILEELPSEDVSEEEFDFQKHMDAVYAVFQGREHMFYGMNVPPIEQLYEVRSDFDETKHDRDGEDYTVTLIDVDAGGSVLYVGNGSDAMDHIYKMFKSHGHLNLADNVRYGILGGEPGGFFDLTLPKYGYSWLDGNYRFENYRVTHEMVMHLKYTKTYMENPKNFRDAYHWITGHPLFWLNSKHDSYVSINEDVNSFEHMLIFGTEGHSHAFEAGAAILPERKAHYHDLRLDVYGETYEDGIIKLAEKVHKFFKYDGSERENVTYEKSGLEKALEASIEEYEADHGAGSLSGTQDSKEV